MQKKLFNRYYLCVWFGSLCLLLVHNMLNNALPLYLASIGFSTSFSGLIGVPFAILGIIGRLAGGYLADSRSRRLVMVSGTALIGVSAFLFGLVPAAAYRLHVRENQLEVDRLDVAGGVDGAVHVDDILVLKAAHDMHNRIDLSDIGQKLVAQSFAFGSSLHQSCDVHKFDDRRSHLCRMIQVGEQLQTLIRYRNHSDIRINGAERIVC